MPLDTEVRLRLDLGANAPIEVLAGVLGDVNLLCLFGGELQRHASRNRAIRQTLRRPGSFLDDPELDYLLGRREPYRSWPAAAFLSGLVSENLEREITTWTAELRLDDDGEALVREVTYRNPLEVALVVAGGGVILTLLRLVRDWPARRRINSALADDHEDQIRARKRVRTAVTEALVEGRLPISPDMTNALLTDDTVRAIESLGRADLSLEESPSSEDPA